MSIEFRRVTGAPVAGKQEGQTPPAAQAAPVVPWIPPASKSQLEERLFYFLRSACDGRPQTTTPLLVEEKTLHALYSHPHPDLSAALCHCLDQFLVELHPDTACWGTLDLSTTVLGVALAANNCLCPSPSGVVAEDSVISFTTALVKTLPPARTFSAMVAYHAVLYHAVASLPFLSADRAQLMRALLDRSPLSAIYYLHLHTPPPLTALAADLWPWWKSHVEPPAPWADLNDWLQPLLLLLAQPALAAYLRRHWLSLSDTLLACRNLGLLLEALRRQGDQRAIILEFYEAFEYFRAQQTTDPRYGKIRRWPLLDHIGHLLRAGGNSEAIIQLNRRGNEYFALFGPLLQITISERGMPHDYYHLKYIIPALSPLLPYLTEASATRPPLQHVEFVSEDK